MISGETIRSILNSSPTTTTGTSDIASPDRELRSGGLVAGLFFVGLLGWAALTPLDSAVVASGVVAIAGNRQTVQHLDGGIVKAIHVREGAFVTKGDILLELIEADLRAEERSLNAQLIELEAQQARLTSEQAGRRDLRRPNRWNDLQADDSAFADQVLRRQRSELYARSAADSARVAVVRAQREQLQSRLPGIENEKLAAANQIQLLTSEIDTLQQLFQKGLAQLPRIRSLEREAANLTGRIGELEAQTVQTQDAIKETIEQEKAIAADRAESRAQELSDVQVRLSDISPRYRAVSAKLERTRLRATATGNVVGLNTFTVGGVIPAGARILDIVPTDRDMVIDASVSPENGDDIKVSDPVKVRFPAINSRSPPTFTGQIDKLSADRMVDEKSGAAFYKVEISITAEGNRQEARLSEYDIRPGMPADVLIPLRKRTALQYIVDPITNSLWTSLREK
jgi:HlyD family secretion protein